MKLTHLFFVAESGYGTGGGVFRITSVTKGHFEKRLERTHIKTDSSVAPPLQLKWLCVTASVREVDFAWNPE